MKITGINYASMVFLALMTHSKRLKLSGVCLMGITITAAMLANVGLLNLT